MPKGLMFPKRAGVYLAKNVFGPEWRKIDVYRFPKRPNNPLCCFCEDFGYGGNPKEPDDIACHVPIKRTGLTFGFEVRKTNAHLSTLRERIIKLGYKLQEVPYRSGGEHNHLIGWTVRATKDDESIEETEEYLHQSLNLVYLIVKQEEILK